MIEYSIVAHPSQYEQVMTILYQREIYPFEEDPAGLQDYIDNFGGMCREKNGLLHFGILSRTEDDDFLRELNNELTTLDGYCSDECLPRLEKAANDYD